MDNSYWPIFTFADSFLIFVQSAETPVEEILKFLIVCISGIPNWLFFNSFHISALKFFIFFHAWLLLNFFNVLIVATLKFLSDTFNVSIISGSDSVQCYISWQWVQCFISPPPIPVCVCVCVYLFIFGWMPDIKEEHLRLKSLYPKTGIPLLLNR